MEVVRPEFLPDPEASREEMEALQRDIAAAATFEDSGAPAPDEVVVPEAFDLAALDAPDPAAGTGPIVVGVDQAFTDDRAVSAAVAVRDGAVIEVVRGEAPLELPYIPGLLAFREAGAIVDALERLDAEPDLLVFDGSGRIHFRQAGIATHVGVCFDVPAVGVAKNLLCGRLRQPIDEPLPEGARIAVEADGDVDAPADEVIGYAYQSRQYPNPERRHVNPLYVSPGHRTAETAAVDLVAATCAGYKLPEPTRLADAAADRLREDNC